MSRIIHDRNIASTAVISFKKTISKKRKNRYRIYQTGLISSFVVGFIDIGTASAQFVTKPKIDRVIFSAPVAKTVDPTSQRLVLAASPTTEVHYFSFNDGGTQGGNYVNDGAIGLNSLAVGVDANARLAGATAIGYKASAQGFDTVAVGTSSTATYIGDVAIGNTSLATGGGALNLGAVALGSNARALGNGNIAIGQNSRASANHAIAIGQDAEAIANRSIAIGLTSYAAQVGDLAVGDGARAFGGRFATAVGNGARADGENASAFAGRALAANAVAVGGTSNNAYSVSLGRQSVSSADSAVAIGQGAIASNLNSVALGMMSRTAAANPTINSTAGGITYENYAGVAPTSVVSVGNAGEERQITNVAAGRVSTSSTDVVNGSQLFATQLVMSNMGTSMVSVLGGDAKLEGDGSVVMTDIGETGKNNVHDAIKSISATANAGWNVSDTDGNESNINANSKLSFVAGNDNLTVELTDESATDSKIEITLADNISLSQDGSLTVGGLTTIESSQILVGGMNPILMSGTTGQISGLTNKSIASIGFADGSGRAATEEQLGSITDFLELQVDGNGNPVFNYNGQYHGTLTNALNSIYWNVDVSAGSPANGGASGGSSGGTDSGGGTATGSIPVYNGNTVEFIAGKNIALSKSSRSGGDGADIQVALADDINLNSVTAVRVEAARVEISDGGPVIDQNGINMSGNRITNLAPGQEQTDAVNVGQLDRTLGDVNSRIDGVRNDLRRQEKRLSGGVAAAMATAALPQAYLPGKNMMAMSGGTWNGESGMAVGYSGVSRGGSWVYKLSGNTTSRGDYGGAVGVGYQW